MRRIAGLLGAASVAAQRTVSRRIIFAFERPEKSLIATLPRLDCCKWLISNRPKATGCSAVK